MKAVRSTRSTTERGVSMVAIAAYLPPLPTHFGSKPGDLRRFWFTSPLDIATIPWNRSFQWHGSESGALAVRFRPPRASISTTTEGTSDQELRLVLELATDEELYELENILYGRSYFSPLLKSISSKPDIDYILEEADDQQREDYITHLESRFFFLAADARSTLRGWRPSYRNVLLGVRRKLNISCSNKLSTEDLEVEIFLHLLQDYSSQENSSLSSVGEDNKLANGGSLGVGLSQWKLQLLGVLRTGAKEFQDMILKGGGMLTLSRIFQLLSNRFSGKLIMEAANYEIKREIMKRGGQMAAINLESRAALLAARKVLQ
ncbi:uncharacterized protein LOC110019996 isoform X2 [Phalaenopsis equestris]|uniref:uncharacterized protein LOC110019996 isoform X2 n=1 Tax=Phalaenopsis equestris TaxID=78828 RepID=UPI0009E20E3E|nr:uncharacterized protein LOC110019996 isoform X2 [Phalaenopsis equestris]